MTDVHKLPDDLPVPVDDGACLHLSGIELPDLVLPSTAGRMVRLREISRGLAVFFFYPRSGQPGATIPAAWDRIPGAVVIGIQFKATLGIQFKASPVTQPLRAAMMPPQGDKDAYWGRFCQNSPSLTGRVECPSNRQAIRR